MVSIFAKSGNNCQKVQITLMEEVLTDLDKEQLKTFSYATKKEETTSKALYCVLTSGSGLTTLVNYLAEFDVPLDVFNAFYSKQRELVFKSLDLALKDTTFPWKRRKV